jgi:transglutaminase-like putative cysteine protease
MLVAFYLAPPRLRLGAWLLAAAGPIAVSVLLGSGIGPYTLPFIGVGAGSFLLTAFLFKTGPKGRSLAFVEPFFLAFIYYKMLSFSRASEATALQSAGITQLLLVASVCAFLLHGLVLYLSTFHRREHRRGLREVVLFLTVAVPVVLVVALILPPDFVKHSVVLNRLKEEPRPKPYPLDLDSNGPPGGNLQSRRQWEEWMRDRFGRDGREQGGRERGGRDPRAGQGVLEGVPADQWEGAQEGEGSEARQYAVMVLVTRMEPAYVADAYFAGFDPERGFVFSDDEPLNELTYLRLLETWKNPQANADEKRSPQEVFTFSTLPERYLAYRPEEVEPTVLNRKYHPFEYSFRAVSLVSDGRDADWTAIEGLPAEDRDRLQRYLQIGVPEEHRPAFQKHLDQALRGRTGYYERIQALMESFSTFQYELGFTDDVSTAQMEWFLGEVRTGDCTEFSNSTAILARMAGIPARVVTGYLGSRNLQTMAHLQGLLVLREHIEPLQEFSLRELILVTSAHRHSWVQLYMPGYGWVDFDPTTYAIPPVGGGDPNNMNVVIPLIQEMENPEVFRFPWVPVLQGLAILVFTGLVSVYLYRYGRQAYLWRLAAGQSPRSLRALYTLLLMRLAESGQPLKSPAETALEYAGGDADLRRFSSLYTMLRYRDRFRSGERDDAVRRMRETYREVSRLARRPGLAATLKRVFSLRGLYY